MTAKICVSIRPKTIAEALTLIEKVENQEADLIEVRLDNLENHNMRLRDISESSQLPKIATNRASGSNGRFIGTESERQQLLLNAARNNFQYIDLELSIPNLRELIAELQSVAAKPIVSFHDYKETPSMLSLAKILGREMATGAEICKIVTTAVSVQDNITILTFLKESCRQTNLVCFSMGALGKPSRILSPIFGAPFTMASLEKEMETAPGQITIQEMKVLYKALEA